jgi:hypothetical protein
MVPEALDEPNAVQQPFASEPTRQNSGKTAVTKVRKPRKQGNASQGRSTLFWVHNDPQSVAEGTREETLKLIRSHVMSEHNRKKRLENNKRYKNKAWKHLAFQPVETADSNPASSSAPPALETSHPAPRKPSRKASRSTLPPPTYSSSSSSKSPSPEQPIYKQDDESEEEETKFTEVGNDYEAVPADSVDDYRIKLENETTLPMVQNPSPWAYVGQGSSDPFSTMHTPISERMHRHLQHCGFTELVRLYPANCFNQFYVN